MVSPLAVRTFDVVVGCEESDIFTAYQSPNVCALLPARFDPPSGSKARKYAALGLWMFDAEKGSVARLVGIEGGVVSGVFNLESSGVSASDWRPRHDEHYHEAAAFAVAERHCPPFRRLV